MGKSNKFFLTFLLLSSFLLSTCNECRSQWVQCNGIYGGKVNALITKGNKIFAGTEYYGVFTSTDLGNTWKQTSLNNQVITCLASYNNTIYAGTLLYGIYKTTNDGINWHDFSSDEYMKAIEPYNGYIATSNTDYPRGVNIYDTLTHTWRNTLYQKEVWSLLWNGSLLFSGTRDHGVYFTSDNGLSWFNCGLNDNTVIALEINQNVIFAGTSGHGVYFSSDNGFSWANSNNLNNKNVISFTSNGNDTYAGSDGVYKSTDFGLTWYRNSTNNNPVKSLTAKDNIIFAGYLNDGIYFSSNNGLNWLQSNLYLDEVNSIFEYGNDIFAGAKHGLYISNDTGKYFKATTLTNHEINAITSCNNILFAGSDNFGVYSSSDSGTTWILTSLNGYPVFSFCTLGNTVYAGTSEGIFVTTNFGNNWTQTGLYNYIIYSLIIKNNIIYAGTQDGIFISTNNGLLWQQSSLTFFKILSLSFNDNFIFAGAEEYGMFTSSNNGINWNQAIFPHTSVKSILTFENYVIAGTMYYPFGVFVSTDYGISWYLKNQGLNDLTHILTINKIKNNIFIGTEFSAWRRTLIDLTEVVEKSSNISSSYLLEQNYPNPFNPSTNIRYQITCNKYVTLKVYDLLGKEVAILVNENQKPGKYEVAFNGSLLPSGIYLYRLEAGDFRETRKMILIK